MRKDVREFIRRLEAVGLTVESTPGHYRVLRDGEPLRKANGMPFMLPFSPDTIRWRRAAVVELRKLGIESGQQTPKPADLSVTGLRQRNVLTRCRPCQARPLGHDRRHLPQVAPGSHGREKRDNTRRPATHQTPRGYAQTRMNRPPPHVHGKEGVSGSSPEEGFVKPLQISGFFSVLVVGSDDTRSHRGRTGSPAGRFWL
jgi:hypothetical protein